MYIIPKEEKDETKKYECIEKKMKCAEKEKKLWNKNNKPNVDKTYTHYTKIHF